MPTRYNAVGKVSNIEVYNFRLARLLHSLHSRRPSPWKSRGLCRYTPQLYRFMDAYGRYANVNISAAVFNKPQLHNIRCRVQTHTACAIFAAVKPTQALTTLRLCTYSNRRSTHRTITHKTYGYGSRPLSNEKTTVLVSFTMHFMLLLHCMCQLSFLFCLP